MVVLESVNNNLSWGLELAGKNTSEEKPSINVE